MPIDAWPLAIGSEARRKERRVCPSETRSRWHWRDGLGRRLGDEGTPGGLTSWHLLRRDSPNLVDPGILITLRPRVTFCVIDAGSVQEGTSERPLLGPNRMR